MNSMNTFPCPVCDEPVSIRYLRSPDGDVTKVYTDPLFSNEEVFSFHQHQAQHVYYQSLH